MHISVDIFHQIAILLWFSMCVFFLIPVIAKNLCSVFFWFSFIHLETKRRWKNCSFSRICIQKLLLGKFLTYISTYSGLVDWLIDWSPWPPQQDNIVCFLSIYQTEKNLRSGFFSFLCFWLSKSFYYDVLNFCCCCCDYIRNSCLFFGSVFIFSSLALNFTLKLVDQNCEFLPGEKFALFFTIGKMKIALFLLCSNNDDDDVDGVLWKFFSFYIIYFYYRYSIIVIVI